MQSKSWLVKQSCINVDTSNMWLWYHDKNYYNIIRRQIFTNKIFDWSVLQIGTYVVYFNLLLLFN